MHLFEEWFAKNKDSFIHFGDCFVNFITDDFILAELASRDLEKLARIFRIIFCSKIGDAHDGAPSPVLRDILAYLKGGEEDC